jgi:hypothetical protein
MQSIGQTSMHKPHRVQLHESIANSLPSVAMAFSGQISLQESHEMQVLLISNVLIIYKTF